VNYIMNSVFFASFVLRCLGVILEDGKQHRLSVLIGTKRVPAAIVQTHQVLLNGSDGLEFQTMVNCSLVYMVKKPRSFVRPAWLVFIDGRRSREK